MPPRSVSNENRKLFPEIRGANATGAGRIQNPLRIVNSPFVLVELGIGSPIVLPNLKFAFVLTAPPPATTLREITKCPLLCANAAVENEIKINARKNFICQLVYFL